MTDVMRIRAWVRELERTVDHPRDFIVVRHGRQIAAGRWRGGVREEGRTPIGGLTRLALLAGAGLAIDRERVQDDAEVEALLYQMMRDTPEGAAAADALSARIERDVDESTAIFLASRLFECLDGGSTWETNAVPWTLRSPRSPATVERLSDGRLAAVWNDHETQDNSSSATVRAAACARCASSPSRPYCPLVAARGMCYNPVRGLKTKRSEIPWQRQLWVEICTYDLTKGKSYRQKRDAGFCPTALISDGVSQPSR